jgi:hypothetical protein
MQNKDDAISVKRAMPESRESIVKAGEALGSHVCAAQPRHSATGRTGLVPCGATF